MNFIGSGFNTPDHGFMVGAFCFGAGVEALPFAGVFCGTLIGGFVSCFGIEAGTGPGMDAGIEVFTPNTFLNEKGAPKLFCHMLI